MIAIIKLKKVKSLVLIILLSAAGILTYLFIYSNKNKESPSSLFVRYPDGFITKTVRIDDSFIALSFDNDKRVYADCPSLFKSPIMYLSGDVSNSYEFLVGRDLHFNVFNERFDLLDVNGDGKNEIVSEWSGNGCGSSGLKGLVIWKLDSQNKLIPLAGYPKDKNEESSFIVKNLKTDKVTAFPEITTDCFTDYQLSSSNYNLTIGCPIWNLEAEESHNDPHIWRIRVYRFENGSFIKDESWNNGKDFITEKKISEPENNDFNEIKEIIENL